MEDNTSSSACYALAPDADSGGTHWHADILLPPAAVIRRFGPAGRGDDFKVSQFWIFRKGDLVFTLYDWKSTNLYEPGLFSPDELWACDEPLDLHIGSKEPATPEDVAAFAAWLEDEVQRDQ